MSNRTSGFLIFIFGIIALIVSLSFASWAAYVIGGFAVIFGIIF